LTRRPPIESPALAMRASGLELGARHAVEAGSPT
jgi:hypothetical protein